MAYKNNKRNGNSKASISKDMNQPGNMPRDLKHVNYESPFYGGEMEYYGSELSEQNYQISQDAKDLAKSKKKKGSRF